MFSVLLVAVTSLLLIYVQLVVSYSNYGSNLSGYNFHLNGKASRCLQMVASSSKVTVVLPSYTTSFSPYSTKPFNDKVTWYKVFTHLQQKILYESLNKKNFISESLEGMLDIKLVSEIADDTSGSLPDILLLVDLDDTHLEKVSHVSKSVKNLLVFDSSSDKLKAMQKLDKFVPFERGIDSSRGALSGLRITIDKLLKTDNFKSRYAYDLVQDLWSRRNIDDLLFLVLVLVDTFTPINIDSVKSVTSTETTSLKQVQCMSSKCLDEMINCFKNPSCRKALDCLNSCKGNDQVCSYKCITSYETEAFEKFAFCILQKNNCMGNKATLPVHPNPSPLKLFRGNPLSHKVAEQIFIGHLEGQTDIHEAKLSWSWKVVAGQNPAYDYFNCQHQIFYFDQRGDFFYDPVFKVVTLDDQEVWRRRHYKVKRGFNPGQFYFSVLDNGVRSSEFWRILDVDEDLRWAVFYYTGAAAAAGTSYTGALLCSADGEWPTDSDSVQRIDQAMAAGGIKMWELYNVCNENCSKDDTLNKAGAPPLGILTSMD